MSKVLFLSLSLSQELLTLLNSLLYRADIEESLLWQVVKFTVQDHIEALDGIFY